MKTAKKEIMQHYYKGDYPTTEEVMRNRLIDGCLLVIENNGIQKLSIRDIAKQTGVARPTVYKHFKNKNEILSAAFRREGLSFAIEVADAIREVPDVEDKFVYGFLYVLDNFNKNPILAQVVEPGSTFLNDVGMKDYRFADFGLIVYQQVFDKYPILAEDSDSISELWIRNGLSFISMPGPEKSAAEMETYIRQRLIPGLGLKRIKTAN